MSETPVLPSEFGFVGLGAMGGPMVLNLRKKLPKQTSIFIYDVFQPAMDTVAEACGTVNGGVLACRSGREVAEKSEIIITIVPEGRHVRDLYLAETTGLLAASSDVSFANKIFVDCSTIDVATSSTVCSAVQSHQAHYVDAPVSGGTLGAEAGTLTFMVGIAETNPQFPSIKAILELMGTNIFACGGPTLGLAVKLSNNYISGLIAIATAEGMNVGMRLGVDPKVLSRVFSTSTAQSYINDKCNPVPGVSPGSPPSNGYKPGFKSALMAKDFALAVDAADAAGAKLILGPAGLSTYQAMRNDEDFKDLDSRSVYRWLGGQE